MCPLPSTSLVLLEGYNYGTVVDVFYQNYLLGSLPSWYFGTPCRVKETLRKYGGPGTQR